MKTFELTYRQLPETMYTDIRPVPVKAPRIIIFNEELADFLGLDKEIWRDPAILSGNQMVPDTEPLAQAYVGHQFGYPAMLGDGRAHLIAEVIASDDVRHDIQLKGSGRTPYSRGGDGRAGVGPMLREYLVSEAMHALGIPTSRSLAVVETGEPVMRDQVERGAILTRVAKSHIRVGTFQYALYQGVIKEVADYTIERHDPECKKDNNPYLCLYQNIVQRQAHLIADWQAIGFIHGVMNTDNMALSGETIDYGPCAFMDIYRHDQVFSSIDRGGRYRYKQQPLIAKWNLARLGETLIPLVDQEEEIAADKIRDVLDTFDQAFAEAWLEKFSKKLALPGLPTDEPFIKAFLDLLESEEKDFTNSFNALTDHPEDKLFTSEAGRAWQEKWRQRVTATVGFEEAQAIMKATNPRVIPRNIQLQDALDAAEAGNMEPFNTMLAIVKDPFAEHVPDAFLEPTPKYHHFVTYCGT
ncbi:MAG TPA: YdiU family protein [Fastidiosipila sp.]|nr:YdiU family protein [Fastidiosipila sp.]